jgi:hypothetical protein
MPSDSSHAVYSVGDLLLQHDATMIALLAALVAALLAILLNL